MLNNQKLLKLVIVSFIRVTLIFHSGVILEGEYRCWHCLGQRINRLWRAETAYGGFTPLHGHPLQPWRSSSLPE